MLHRSRATFLGAVAASIVSVERVGAQQSPSAVLRVTCVPNDDVTPMLYAQRAGLFNKAGIEVEVTRNTSGAAIAAAVAGGSYDIGLASMMALVSGHVHGLPFVMVAPSLLSLTGDGYSEMAVLATSPVRSARDLSGKVLAVASIMDLDWLSSRKFVDDDGGDSASIKFVELPQPAVPPALEEGRIDAAVLLSPTLDRAMATGHFRTLGNPISSIASRFSTADWFTTSGFLAHNRDLVDRFARAMLAATIYANAHHAETAPLIIAFSGMDPAAASLLHRATCAEYLDPRDIQPPINAAATYKIIDNVFPAQELISPYALKPPR